MGPRGLFAVGLAIGALVGGGVAFLLADGDAVTQPERPEVAFSPVGEPLAGELAERFRPRLYFDSEERWRPVSISSLLGERGSEGPAHRFCTRLQQGQTCVPIDGIGDFEDLVAANNALGGSTFVDIAGEELGEYAAPGRCAEPRLLDCGEAPESAIYYRVTSSNGRYYVDYWWFLRYNDFDLTRRACDFTASVPCGTHEGDWEGVTLVTPPGEDPARLDYAAYAAHEGTFRYPAEQLTGEDGRRPDVFVARGSHAAYPERCDEILCWQPVALVGRVDVPETSTDGRRRWARNEEDCEPGAEGSCLQPLPTAAPGHPTWTAWPGLWGATCGTRCGKAGAANAPESPGVQTRFQSPFCSIQGGVVTCDSVAPGCSDWLGPVVAALACDPKALKQGLRSPEQLANGDLNITIAAKDGEARTVSATTRGVVQALGSPLRAGDRVVFGGVGAGTEVLVRARNGDRVLEARFEPPESAIAAGGFEVVVEARGEVPVALGRARGETGIEAVEERRFRVAGEA